MGSLSKLGGAGLGGALGTVLVYIIEAVIGRDLPGDVDGAIITLCAMALTYVFPANTPTPEAVKTAVAQDATVAVAAKEGLAAQAEAAKPGPLPGGHSSTMPTVR